MTTQKEVADSSSVSDNLAWASLKTAMSVNELTLFCTDIERLFRINPYLEFIKWQTNDASNVDIHIRNISNVEPVELETNIIIDSLNNGFKVNYAGGIKSHTTFKIEADETGSMLTIIDDYHDIQEGDQEALKQVDKSIVAWAKDIQEYIFKWQRWKWLAPWRWYMQGPWQKMKPPARRISYMLFWITFAELLGFFLVFIIFWYDFDEFFKI